MRRYAIAGLVVLVIVGALAAVKLSQIATLIAYAEEGERRGPPPEAVGAAVAREQVWPETLEAVGTVTSGRDVAIRTEVPGVVARVGFESGESVREGELLVELDASVERADLAAAIAAERLARATARRAHELAERGVVSEEERDRAEADLATTSARVAGLRATIAKKMIRAPFAGRVGIREVNRGQLVEVGTTITAIGAGAGALVDFSLPQEDVSRIAPGVPVELRFGERTFTGTLSALEPRVDPATRAIGLRAEVRDDDEGLLRPGMFVDVSVLLPQQERVVVVPHTAIVHAPYGDSVFVLEDRPARAPGPARTAEGAPIRIARQTFVRTGRSRGDFVAVLAGVRAGQEVVTAGAFKLTNGAPVYVTEEGVPSPELRPRPESR